MSHPPDASAPVALNTESGDVRTSTFLYVTLKVSRPTPLGLLQSIVLRGTVPDDAEHLSAHLHDMSASTLLQVIPGAQHATAGKSADAQSTTATFSQVQSTATLEAGRTYLMQFQERQEEGLPVTFANESGLTPAYFSVIGQNPDPKANDNRWYHVTAQGQLVPMQITDRGSDGTADYNIPFPTSGTFRLPLMSAGRIYISLGARMKTQLNPGTQPTDPPAFWVAPNAWSNPGDPNYLTLFDWIEFDYKISPDSLKPGMGINKTEVQMVSLPFHISMTGPTSGTQTVGAKPGAHGAIFTALLADATFSTLVIKQPSTGAALRAVSPDNGIYNTVHKIPNTPTFNLAYYDAYIDQVWSKYRNEDLTMLTSAFGTYKGRVSSSNQMVFTQSGSPDIVIEKPTTSDVIIGNGALVKPAQGLDPSTRQARVVNEIASAMSAAFNRTTLLTDPTMTRNYCCNNCKPATYYQASPTNLYSRVIHENSLPTASAPFGAAYGFGYDDNCDQSSFISDNKDPSTLTITVPKF